MVVIRHDTMDYHNSLHFQTLDDAYRYRASQIKTDNPGFCEGIWTMQAIGPDKRDDGCLMLSNLESWRFIGQWADDGNDHQIIGHERMGE